MALSYNSSNPEQLLLQGVRNVPFLLPGAAARLHLLTWGTGHDLHIVIGTLPSFQLLHQVLDVPEPIGQGKVEQDLPIPLQSHLLEVLVPREQSTRNGFSKWVSILNFKECKTQFFCDWRAVLVLCHPWKIGRNSFQKFPGLLEPPEKVAEGYLCWVKAWKAQPELLQQTLMEPLRGFLTSAGS